LSRAFNATQEAAAAAQAMPLLRIVNNGIMWPPYGNTTGLQRVRYWDQNKNRVDPPADHSGLSWTVRVELRAVWVSGGCWGLVALATDLLQKEVEVVQCPF
jgi:hypothetical protein